MLPESDLAFLKARNLSYSANAEGGMVAVIVQDWQVPPGYDRTESDLLIRLPVGYPDVQPDMWWFDPPVRLPSGGPIPATDSIEAYGSRQWQRWSRHFAAGQWKSGIDGLESYLALIYSELARFAVGAA